MRFHEHALGYKEILQGLGVKPDNTSWRDRILYEHVMTLGTADAIRNIGVQLHGETHWVDNGRPYYDVYPAIHEAFMRVDLSHVKCEDVRLPVPHLVLRFPVGKELMGKVQSVLISDLELPFNCDILKKNVAVDSKHPQDPGKTGRVFSIAINDGSIEDVNIRIHAHTLTNMVFTDGLSLGDIVDLSPQARFTADELDEDMIRGVIKLIVAICLIGKDPDIVDELCLTDDQRKFDEGDIETRRKLLEKAARRGKIAWAVGRHVEIAPGFRRPHFGFRWCGVGRTALRLRPISGCIVKRKLITEVPTGELGDG